MPKALTIDDSWAEWATEKQLVYIKSIQEHGSCLAAGAALGINPSVISRSMVKLKALASTKGYSPEHDWTRAVPDTHVAKGVSTYYNKEGKASGQWVKADLRLEAYREAVRDAMKAFVEDLPAVTLPSWPLDRSTDVIPWIQIGDAHVGMLAHAAEVGENFDLKIAEQELLSAIQLVIAEMPACERCVINDLGDFTHYDNFAGETAQSGHKLDYDGRFPKMLRTYSRIMRTVIEMALGKAKFVDVIINQGNHSRVNDFWMRELLEVAYGKSGRVNVLSNDSVFICYRMGKTMVVTHHSDKTKPGQLAAVMANDFAKDWGETEFRYGDVGHVHHSRSIETGGAVVESWNILAPNDKYSHDGGWRSRRALSVVLRSRTYGEIGRRTVHIQEVWDRLAARGVAARQHGKQAFVA